ncbi:hypothetical protein [Pseudomonas aeruginosa]
MADHPIDDKVLEHLRKIQGSTAWAMRYAIVRAAAEIGKSMGGGE